MIDLDGHRHTQPAQDILDLDQRNLHAQQGPDARRAQTDRRFRRQMLLRHRLDQRPRLAPGNLQQQPGGTLGGTAL